MLCLPEIIMSISLAPLSKDMLTGQSRIVLLLLACEKVHSCEFESDKEK